MKLREIVYFEKSSFLSNEPQFLQQRPLHANPNNFCKLNSFSQLYGLREHRGNSSRFSPLGLLSMECHPRVSSYILVSSPLSPNSGLHVLDVHWSTRNILWKRVLSEIEKFFQKSVTRIFEKLSNVESSFVVLRFPLINRVPLITRILNLMMGSSFRAFFILAINQNIYISFFFVMDKTESGLVSGFMHDVRAF